MRSATPEKRRSGKSRIGSGRTVSQPEVEFFGSRAPNLKKVTDELRVIRELARISSLWGL